ncbi:unnamed protein product [Ectocarpus sp. 6 AP-2014]
MAQNGRGVKLCFGDVQASWTQVLFCAILVTVLVVTTVDLFTACYTLHATEDFLTWLDGENMLAFIVIFIAFGALSIVMLLPQTVLFLAAGYACADRVRNRYLAFAVALNLSLVTFIIGASIAFLLARSVLPPSCTRKFFKHFAILEGLDHALKHKGRRIIILLRINPMAPYNALNYGLGLSSCTFRAYLQGMVGAFPFTCIAVYAGMLISSVDDIDSLFTYTSTGWYCVYAALGVACVASFVAIVRYTSAEMKAAVRSAPIPAGGDRVDGEEDFGELPPDSTMFGTFTSRSECGSGMEGGEGNAGAGGEEEEEAMETFDEIVVAREPLLGGDARRKNGVAAERTSKRAARLTPVVDV